MAEISAVIITKNEERNIGRCLESLSGVADEIVVVDSLSEDRTREICESFPGVRFIEKEWMGYSDTKNYANTLAGYDFVLSLDADEQLSEELREEILGLKKDLSEDRAFYLSRLTNYCGKWIRHSGWHPDFQMRLFPKSGAEWNGAAIHESIVLDAGIKTSKLTGLLLHYSYYSIEEHLERAKNYTDLAARQMVQKGKRFLLIRFVANPFLSFIRNYFLKLGILDGYYGLVISVIGSYVVFLKYYKAWKLD